jgi:hypothetical protein
MKSFAAVALFVLIIGIGTSTQAQYSGSCPTCVVTASGSVIRTTWTLTTGTGLIGGSVPLLNTSLATGLYVVTVSANQHSLGNCPTGGTIQLEFSYFGVDQGLAFTSAGTPDTIAMANNAGSLVSNFIQTQGTTGGNILRGGWHSIPLSIYAQTGTALTVQARQTTSASGSGCTMPPTVITSVTVQGPY